MRGKEATRRISGLMPSVDLHAGSARRSRESAMRQAAHHPPEKIQSPAGRSGATMPSSRCSRATRDRTIRDSGLPEPKPTTESGRGAVTAWRRSCLRSCRRGALRIRAGCGRGCRTSWRSRTASRFSKRHPQYLGCPGRHLPAEVGRHRLGARHVHRGGDEQPDLPLLRRDERAGIRDVLECRAGLALDHEAGRIDAQAPQRVRRVLRRAIVAEKVGGAARINDPGIGVTARDGRALNEIGEKTAEDHDAVDVLWGLRGAQIPALQRIGRPLIQGQEDQGQPRSRRDAGDNAAEANVPGPAQRHSRCEQQDHEVCRQKKEPDDPGGEVHHDRAFALFG